MISILSGLFFSDPSNKKCVALGDRTNDISLDDDDDEGANSNSFYSCFCSNVSFMNEKVRARQPTATRETDPVHRLVGRLRGYHSCYEDDPEIEDLRNEVNCDTKSTTLLRDRSRRP